ncbi:uncharacterized protein LOC120342136 [Styela clava]
MNIKLYLLVVLASFIAAAYAGAISRAAENEETTNEEPQIDVPTLRTSCATQCDIEAERRHECGGFDVTKDSCLESGCCYDDKAEDDGVIKCYHKDISLCDQPECIVLVEDRVPCEVPDGFKDYAHIIMKDSMYCSSMPDCCWDDSFPENSMYSRCFKKKERKESVEVMVATQTRCHAILKEDRKECGHARMTERECVQKGCCWKPVNDHSTPWCYHNTEETEEAEVPHKGVPHVYGITENISNKNRDAPAKCGILDYRKPCGGKNMTMNECKFKGCCWAASNIDTYKCFKSAQQVPVANTQTPTAATPSNPIVVNPAPTDVYGKVLGGANTTPQVDNTANTYNNINQIQENRNPISTNTPVQQTVNPMSAMAQMLIFCGKKKGNLCNMAILSMMGGNQIVPATKVPTMSSYLNYLMRRGTYQSSSNNEGARTTLTNDGRIYMTPTLTGDDIHDEMCFNTTELKQFAKFHSPCGGLHTPKTIQDKSECIAEGCCWVDDYHSLLREMFKVGDGLSASAFYSAFGNPVLGLDGTGSTNCLEALKYSQIKQIGRMAMIQAPKGGIPTQLLPMLMESDNDDSSAVDSLMMAAMMGGGGMSFPLAMALTEKEEDSKVILPLIMGMMQEISQPPTQGQTGTGQAAGNDIMSILPLYLAMGNNKDMSKIAPLLLTQMNGGAGQIDPTILSFLLNDEDEHTGESSSLPLSLILSMTQMGQGQKGSTPGINPMLMSTMMSMMGEGGDNNAALIPILMNAAQASMASQSALYSSSGETLPTGQDNQYYRPGDNTNQQGQNTQTPSYYRPGDNTNQQGQNTQAPVSPMNLLMLTSLMNGKGSSSLKDILPFFLMQKPQQQQGTEGNTAASSLSALLPYLSLSEGSDSNNMMLMQVLSNPELMKNPNQMMPLILSQMGSEDGEDGNKMSGIMMAMAMSQATSQGQSPGQQQGANMMSLMMPLLLANKNSNDSKSDIAPLVMQMAMSGGDPNAMQSLAPLLLAQSTGGDVDQATLQMLMNPSIMSGNNPALSLMLLNNKDSDKPMDPMLMNMLMSPQAGSNGGSSLATALLLSQQGSQSEDGAIDPMLIQMMMNPGLGNPGQSYTPGQTGNTGYTPSATQPNPLLNVLLPSLLNNNNEDSNDGNNGLLTQLLLAQAGNGAAASPFGMNPLLQSPSLMNIPTQPNTYPPNNPFAFPASNPGLNPFGFTGFLTQGHDGEHSTQPEVSEECSFPPGAEKQVCDVIAGTEDECRTANCCWDSDAEADIKCYKAT